MWPGYKEPPDLRQRKQVVLEMCEIRNHPTYTVSGMISVSQHCVMTDEQ